MTLPSITSVQYNVASGVLTVTGAGLVSGLNLAGLTLYGNGSLTLSAGDTIGNLTATGFKITLDAADLSKAALLFPGNGDQYSTSSGLYDYQLYAAAGWDGSTSLPQYYTQPLPVTSARTLSISGIGNGSAISLNDNVSINPFHALQLADSDSVDRLSATITLTAANGVLSGSGLSAPVLSSAQATYTLFAASPAQMLSELQALTFTPTLHQVLTTYRALITNLNLSITSSDNAANNQTVTEKIAVSTTSPNLGSVEYDAVHGVFTIGGSNLETNLQLNHLTAVLGNHSIVLDGAGDTISQFSAYGFTLSLGAADQAAVNALFASNGSSNGQNTDTLSAAAGWDGTGVLPTQTSVNASYQTISLSGLPGSGPAINDTTTGRPFQNLLLTDSNSSGSDTALITVSGAAGSLSGAGLSAAIINNGTASYTLAATSAANLQEQLQALIFTPVAGQSAVGTENTVNFSLTVSDPSTAHGSSATLDSANARTNLAINGSLPAAALALSSYNTVTGVLQVNGSSITFGLNLADLTLSGSSGSYQLSATSGTVSTLGAGGFQLALNSAAQSAVNALFIADGTGGGVYQLQALGGWDGAATQASTASVVVSHDSIVIGGLGTTTIKDFITAMPLSAITVSDNLSESLTATITLPSADGSLTGAGLSGGNGSYTLSAANAAALQSDLRQLSYSPALSLVQSGNGATVSVPIGVVIAGSSSPLDNTSLQATRENVAVIVPTSPGISSAGYDAASGQLSISGNNLQSGAALNALTLYAGTQFYTLTGVGDSFSVANAQTLNITLAGADLSAVNALLNLYGNGNSAGSYTLSAAAGWDGLGSTANSGTAVPVSYANSIKVSGLSNASLSTTAHSTPFANVTVSDSNPAQSDGVTIHFAAADGTLSGTGLSAGISSGGVISYTLAKTTPMALQSELAALQFTPAAGLKANVNFSLDFSGATAILPVNPEQTITTGLNYPVAMAVSNSGEIFAASFNGTDASLNNGLLTGYSSSGALLFTVNTGVSLPSALATDSQGNVYVANYNSDLAMNGSVSEYSADGHWLRTFTGMSNVQSVVVNAGGDVFVACTSGNLSSTGYVEEFSASGTLLNVLTNGIDDPTSLTLDSSGNLYVANFKGGNVEEFSSSGVLLNTFSQGVQYPNSLAVAGNGDVYISSGLASEGTFGPNSGVNVAVFAPDGTLLSTDTAGLLFPDGVAINSNGDVFVSDIANQTISEFSADGKLLTTVSTGIADANSLYVNSAGDLYAANMMDGSIIKYAAPVLDTSAYSDNYDTTLIGLVGVHHPSA